MKIRGNKMKIRGNKKRKGIKKGHRKRTENVTETSQKTSQKIIDWAKDDPYITTSKMADIIGVDRRNIARNIKKLQNQGVIRRVGPDKGGFWEIISE